MAKIRLKFAIGDIQETLYEVNLKRSHQEETGSTKLFKTSRKPRTDSSPEASEAQTAQRRRFKEAVLYARAAMVNPEVCAWYKAMGRKQGRGARGAAIADYMSGNDLLAKK